MNCKLCDTEMLPLYAYPHTVPEVIPFKACKKTYPWVCLVRCKALYLP